MRGECSKTKRAAKCKDLKVRVCQVSLRNSKKVFMAGKG